MAFCLQRSARCGKKVRLTYLLREKRSVTRGSAMAGGIEFDVVEEAAVACSSCGLAVVDVFCSGRDFWDELLEEENSLALALFNLLLKLEESCA